MEDQHLESSWKEAGSRFRELKRFVTTSVQSSPQGDQSYRASLYSSWILLTYAATQAALIDLAKVTLQLIGSVATTPELLPDELRKEHIRRTLSFLHSQVVSGSESEEFEEALKSITTSEWFKHTRLTHIEGNVWPNVIKEWMRRMNVDDERIQWMDSPLADSSETVGSRLAQLVRERNAIAHGEVPENFLAPEVMCAWIEDSSIFVRGSVNTLQGHLADTFALESQIFGEVNRSLNLGDNTIGLLRAKVGLSVDDHVRLYTSGGTSRIARVVSIQSHSEPLERIQAGQSEVAITLNKKIQQHNDLYLVL